MQAVKETIAAARAVAITAAVRGVAGGASFAASSIANGETPSAAKTGVSMAGGALGAAVGAKLDHAGAAMMKLTCDTSGHHRRNARYSGQLKIETGVGEPLASWPPCLGIAIDISSNNEAD